MSRVLDFSGFETGNLLAWTQAGTPTIESYGATGDHAVRLNSTDEAISKTFSTTDGELETYTVGCNIEPHVAGIFEMQVTHAGNSWAVRLEYDIDHWELHLLESSISRDETELIVDLYDTINIALVLKPTGGTVFVDGTSTLNYDKDTVGSSGVTLAKWIRTSLGDFLIDDTYVVKSGFPGIIKIAPVRPAVDDLNKLEMAVTGATYHNEAVNVHPEDGDTSYVSTASGIEEDWFVSSLVTDQLDDEDPRKVLALKVSAVSKLISASPTLKIGIITKENDTSTPDFSDTKNLTSSYVEYDYIWENNPESDALWIAGEFWPSVGPEIGIQHSGDARTTQVAGEVALITVSSGKKNRGAGGFDLAFRIPVMGSSQSVTVQTNVDIGGYYGGSTVAIANWSGKIYATISGIGYGSKPTPDAEKTFKSALNGSSPIDVRILYHDKFISVYLNEWWFFTTGFDGMKYKDDLSIKMYSTGWSPTITNIVNRELGDWREAIFIDMETPASSALGSVIQDRPVLIWPNPDGSLRFSYGDSDDGPISLSNNILRKHDRIKSNDPRAAADVIVRGGDVSVMQDSVYATTKGFQTRVYNLGSLDSGAVEAARRLLIRARENAIRHQITIRPDMRVMIGDEISVSYTSVGGRTEAYDMVVESIAMSALYGDGTMTIQGREI